MNKKATVILVTLLILALTLLGYSLLADDSKGYENKEKILNNPCAALSPECGYCAGEKIDGYCYWNDQDLRDNT